MYTLILLHKVSKPLYSQAGPSTRHYLHAVEAVHEYIFDPTLGDSLVSSTDDEQWKCGIVTPPLL